MKRNKEGNLQILKPPLTPKNLPKRKTFLVILWKEIIFYKKFPFYFECCFTLRNRLFQLLIHPCP